MPKDGFITKKGSSCYYQRPGSGGNALHPPGDAENSWHIEEERGGVVVGFMSLRYVEDSDYMPITVRARARRLLRQSKPQMDESWLQSVYNYFRNCYSPDGKTRDTGHMLIDSTNSLPAEHHLAVLHVRSWFPDHAPRLDLIAESGPLGFWHRKKVEND